MAASYTGNGFSVGLQSTNLFQAGDSLQRWLDKQAQAWQTLCGALNDEPQFLGVDTSVAPLFDAARGGSLVALLRDMAERENVDAPRDGDWLHAVTTSPLLLRLTSALKAFPRATGLCGLMFPCLEDFELAAEYEKGHFTIERNIFASLHSGLGA